MEEEVLEWERLLNEQLAAPTVQGNRDPETKPAKTDMPKEPVAQGKPTTEESSTTSSKKITQRYALPLLATGTAAAGAYLELAILEKYPWETSTSWAFFLFMVITQCLLCKANLGVNLPAMIFAYFCMLSSVGIFLFALLEIIVMDDNMVTAFDVLLLTVSYLILLWAKPVSLLFLTATCLCLRNKIFGFLCLPLLISCWLSDWINGWDYRAFVISAFGIILMCSLATMLDEKSNKQTATE